MALRCSLIGHKYDEQEIEREREERGDEVVIITKEYDVCALCGERTLVSESKEVTSDQPAEESSASADMASTEPDTPASDTSPAAEPADTDAPSAEEDDAVILDDDDATAESEPPDWPATDAAGDSGDDAEPQPWPEPEGTDEGFDATSPSAGESPDVDYVGLQPSAEGTETADEASGELINPSDQEATTISAGPSPDETPRPTEDMELVCPECGFTDTEGHGSLRRGDICPECLNGYLAAAEEHNK